MLSIKKEKNYYSCTKKELLELCKLREITKYKSKPKSILIQILINFDEIHKTTNIEIPENYIIPENEELNNLKSEEITNVCISDNIFDLNMYLVLLDNEIKNVLSRHEKDNITYDILDTSQTIKYKNIILKEKQRQMKIGEIWQIIIGNYDGFINLKNGNEYGLDVLSHSKKIVIELKNRTNTDNASSRKTNLDKLSKFKKSNPEYMCIYATINADTKLKTYNTPPKIVKHNDVDIYHYVGYEFLNFIFGKNTKEIIEFVKNTIDKYTT
jgi:hypothetical protein